MRRLLDVGSVVGEAAWVEARTIVAIVLASLLVLALLTWLAWRILRGGARLASRAVQELSRPDGADLALDGRVIPSVLSDPMRTVGSIVDVLRPSLLPSLAPDGTITLVFSDLEASTALNVTLGDDAFASLLSAHEQLARRAARDHRGRLVKSAGDGLMLAFKRPHDAVAFAIDFQRSLTDLDVDAPVKARIGVHTGEAVSRSGDYVGANVAFAARVSSRADGGQVLVSEPVRTAVDVERLGASYGRTRRHRLDGLPGRHPLHPVRWEPRS